MNAFLQQYGIAIFTIVIISIMILIASPISSYIQPLIKEEIVKSTEVLNRDNVTKLNKKNEYGFYFERIYSTGLTGPYRTFIAIKEDGTVYNWVEIDKHEYEKDRKSDNPQYKEETLEEANANFNKDVYGTETGQIVHATFKDHFLRAEEIPDQPLYFSEDGKKIYYDEELTQLKFTATNKTIKTFK